MSSDKALYLNFSLGQCYWLLYTVQDLKFGQFQCDISEKDWTQELLKHIKTIKMDFKRVHVNYASEFCRFAILSAQQIWPDHDMLNYLTQQAFKRIYPNYNADNFVIINDKLKFNQPCLLVAVPKNLYQGLYKLGENLNIVETNPSLISVLNSCKNLQHEYDLVFIENKFSFKVKCLDSYPVQIDVLPFQLYESNFSDLVISLKDIKMLIDSFSPKIKKIVQSGRSKLPEEYNQYLNLLSVK